jgi:uncharacterized membrane protein
MSKIPLNAKAECADGACGESITVIVNPVSQKVSHVVVQVKDLPAPNQRLVPIDQVAETTPDLVRLRCTKDELAEMEPFTETHYIETDALDAYPAAFYGGESAWGGSYYMSPYATMPQTIRQEVEEERVPPGELAVHRGTFVEATDGYVGSVGELVIDPEGEYITHFVLKAGHLWGKKEITLPLAAIDHVLRDTVYLKLDKQAIERLPAIPVQRHYDESKVDKGRIDLVARVYDSPDKARRALEHVEDLHRRKTIKIRNAAMLVKDEEGKLSVQDTRDVDARHGRLFGAVTGGLMGLLAGPGGAVIGALAGAGVGRFAAQKIDMGFSDEFLGNLEKYLQPGSAAVIVLAEHQWADQMHRAWSDLEGVVFQQTLTDRLVEDFMEASGEEH